VLVLFICNMQSSRSIWHAFDKKLTERINHTLCADFNNAKFDKEWYSTMQLWPGLHNERHHQQADSNREANSHSLNRGIHGWRWAVDEIWKSQHHSTQCKTQRFLIGSDFGFGFGAEMHVWGAALGAALSLNRVFIQSPDVNHKYYTANEFCTNSSSKSNLDCYYEPWTDCALEDALGPQAVDMYHAVYSKRFPGSHRADDADAIIAKYNGPLYTEYTISDDLAKRLGSGDPGAIEKVRSDLEPFQTVFIWNHNEFRLHMPIPMRAFTDTCLPMEPRFRYYWWRAVSVAYMIRPNEHTLAWLKEQRDTNFPGRFESETSTTASSSVSPATPVTERPPPVVSMYIRHGDKGSEMHLVDAVVYLDAAVHIFDKYLQPHNGHEQMRRKVQDSPTATTGAHPNSTEESTGTDRPTPSPTARVIFFGTETVEVMKDVLSWGDKHPSYVLLYTSLFDRGSVDVSYGKRHDDWEYPSMLLNLDLSLRSDAWVGTLGSNWCRVVDELRATVAGKEDLPFADLSEKTCPHPPCIEGGIADFDWR
jgi:hypothetical protein